MAAVSLAVARETRTNQTALRATQPSRKGGYDRSLIIRITWRGCIRCGGTRAWYDARVAVSKVWLIERTSTTAETLSFFDMLFLFFIFFFLDELKLLYYVHILKFIEQLNVWREVDTCKNTRYFAYIYSICNLKLFRERYLRTNDRSRIYKGWNGEEKRRDKCANGLEESGVWK